MTASDSRDSVERVVNDMRKMAADRWAPYGVRQDVTALADRLQALARGPQQDSHGRTAPFDREAPPRVTPDTSGRTTDPRGPQQAGGEDVPEKVVAWMNEREAWRSPRAPSEPGTYALVLADDYAALQAEVARLLGQNERLASAVRDTITRAETAEAALREADAASKEPR